eukprot:NODE_1594_length_1105_cov_269.964762.p1 GENE.NODE_1594_length_1105_cov_269.964762~~NODE_1594_length_1105_cov_269.964762.p1  ORF type:complete len:222 (-),score=87.18 NODE_1594_length_1105_cov_269.964762:422-1087(-)
MGLAAAGLGQMVSDSVGITLQGLIERFSDRIGLPSPGLTRAQERLSIVKNVTQASRTIGIVVGCGIGMFPLLYLGEGRARLMQKLFDLLPPDKEPEVTAALETAEFFSGEFILECDMPCDYIYVIINGDVDVISRDANNNEVLSCTLEPGDLVGDLEVLHGKPCIADYIASSELITKRISRAKFLDILGESGRSVCERLAKEEVQVDSRYVYREMKRSLSA